MSCFSKRHFGHLCVRRCRTVAVQQRAAFSVARATNEYPDKASVIRFTNVITNILDDYNTNTGHFR